MKDKYAAKNFVTGAVFKFKGYDTLTEFINKEEEFKITNQNMIYLLLEGLHNKDYRHEYYRLRPKTPCDRSTGATIPCDMDYDDWIHYPLRS